MSTLRATNIKHELSATNQIVLGADGSIGGTLGDTLAAKADTSSLAVMQVKSTRLTAAFSTSSTSYVDWTNLNVSITPTSASNLVLLYVAVSGYPSTVGPSFFFGVDRGTGILGEQRIDVTAAGGYNTNGMLIVHDSPASTSALTYQVKARISSGTWSAPSGLSYTIVAMETAP